MKIVMNSKGGIMSEDVIGFLLGEPSHDFLTFYLQFSCIFLSLHLFLIFISYITQHTLLALYTLKY